jgi:hypothetical protein
VITDNHRSFYVFNRRPVSDIDISFKQQKSDQADQGFYEFMNKSPKKQSFIFPKSGNTIQYREQQNGQQQAGDKERQKNKLDESVIDSFQ